jgi:hypothetical protein
MSIGLPSLAVLAPVVLFGAGCAYNDRVDNRVSTYDIAAERARDEMILTNIVRASRAEPLAFVQLGQVTGSATAGGQLGLPSLVLGPPAASAATQVLQQQAVFGANAAETGFASNSVNMSGSTNFNVTPTETKEFYEGLLEPVDPETLHAFVGQGIARELLFYLFTEKLIEKRAGAVHQFLNDPLDQDYTKEFQEYVNLAIQSGISAEEDPRDVDRIQKEKRENLAKKFDVTVDVSTATQNGGQSAEEQKPKWRLCFDLTLSSGIYAKRNGRAPMCGSHDEPVDPQGRSLDRQTVTFPSPKGGTVVLQVQPRSTFAIFQFLGRLVAESRRGNPPIALQSIEATDSGGPFEDQDLFVLTSGSPNGCFLELNYDGQNYCVPNQGSGAINTKRILGLLAQLLALNTSVNEIPTTPQVQVVP